MSAVAPLTEEEKYLVAILMDPSGSELAEFLFQDDTAPLDEYPYGRYRLWPMQWPYYHCDDKYQIDACGRGVGKASDVNLQVPTPFGWTTMGALKEGDYVFDEMGKPTRVTRAYDVMYGRPCYEVEFSDGTKIVSDESHLWETWDHAARRGNRGDLVSLQERIDRYQRIVQMRGEGMKWAQIAEVEGFADQTGPANLVKRGDPARLLLGPKVRTTAQIRDSLMYNGREHNHSIPTCLPVVMPSRDLPIDPYVLGVWLADGDSHGPIITTGDGWVLEEFERRGLCVKKLKEKFMWSFRLPDGSFMPKLRESGLVQNKHIPSEYLRASVAQRKELLAGLMDSDGHIRERGRCEITQKSRAITDGIYELLCSLGQKPVITEKMSKIYGVEKGVVYVITWRPTFDPFLLPRKSAKFIPLGAQAQRAQHRYIVAVRPVESRPVRCIEVDSPNRLFLVSEAFIATHNSVSAQFRACAFPFNHPGQEMLITAPEDKHLSLVTDKVKSHLTKYYLLRLMLPGEGRSERHNGISTSPNFQVDFINGSKILSRIPLRDGTGVKGCLGRGTMVLTDRGHVPIEDVVVGDLVLTHMNRWRPVTHTYRFEVDRAVVVSGDGHAGITVSDVHKFYARKMVDGALGDPCWVDVLDPDVSSHFWALSDLHGGGFRWGQIRSVEVVECSEVFDISVAEDASYVAEGIVHHNTHPLVIELDEIQDYVEKGFVELTETIKISEPGAMWRNHGVTNGVGDLHYRLSESVDPDMPFTVHRYMAMHRPTWNADERKAKLKLYGGAEDHPDYVRNIYGKPGSANSKIFVLRRLMACVRNVESAWAVDYNKNVYVHLKLNDEFRDKVEREDGVTVADLVDIPYAHLGDQYRSYWAGMDVGFASDPSEILVFGTTIDDEGREIDRLLLRVTLERFSSPNQRAVIETIFDLYGPRLRRFGLDKTGNGLPIYQELMASPDMAKKIAGYGFSEKVAVELEDRELMPGETEKDLVIRKHVVDYATDALRSWVDERRLELPFDDEMLRHWQMQNMKARGESAARKYWGGPEHSLDAARMYAAAKGLMWIEELLAKDKFEPVIARIG